MNKAKLILCTGDKDAFKAGVDERRFAVTKPHLIIVGGLVLQFRGVDDAHAWCKKYRAAQSGIHATETPDTFGDWVRGKQKLAALRASVAAQPPGSFERVAARMLRRWMDE